jgi:hypothetical protein
VRLASCSILLIVASMSAGNGFALDEYVTPRCGEGVFIPGGTMPKGANETGSCFADVKKLTQGPGPEYYYKDHLNKSFSSRAKGGGFSKLSRDWGKHSGKTPAVGQYETECQLTKKRTAGGTMSKRDRGCQFLDMAISHSSWVPSAGKYDAIPPERRVLCRSFDSSKTDSRNPTKASQVGPGYYNINRQQTEKASISYSGSKEPMKSYFERHAAQRAKIPAPGHNGIPESKVEDRGGRKNHVGKLLSDRPIIPRIRPGVAPPLSARSHSVTDRAGAIIDPDAAPPMPLSAR